MASRREWGEAIARSYGLVDGETIRWRRLGATLGGGLFLTIASVVTGFWLAVGDAITGLLVDLGGFNADVVATIVGTPGNALSATVAAGASFVGGLGVLAFPAAVVIVLIGLYGIARLTDDE